MYRYLLILAALVFSHNTLSYERVVLLAPAAGDIFSQLDAKDKIVGVTRNNFDFPNALKIGSHIKPNVELIKGLNPDLLVISSNRFFSQQMVELIDADVFIYNPTTLEEILVEIDKLGRIINKKDNAKAVVKNLKTVLKEIKNVHNKPSVVYEVTENPYMIAGRKSIVNSIINTAGGVLFSSSNRKIAKFNIESVLMQNPNFYIYQQGPMNKTPTPPMKRSNFSLIQSEFIKVDQLSFSRPTTESFYHALKLNKLFLSYQK